MKIKITDFINFEQAVNFLKGRVYGFELAMYTARYHNILHSGPLRCAFSVTVGTSQPSHRAAYGLKFLSVS